MANAFEMVKTSRSLRIELSDLCSFTAFLVGIWLAKQGLWTETIAEWLNKVWPKEHECYSDSDIYNADETGIF
jgi:hypothetical protein